MPWLWEPGLCSGWEGRKLLLQLLGVCTGSVPAPVFHSRNEPPGQCYKHVYVSPWQSMMARNAKSTW